ncbi:MAG: hypothetical protein LBV27_00855 [Oscillospiraceae bacterium]|jgi:flagellin|nr:hypothetical protein [Oscillospiraceae bacterium]
MIIQHNMPALNSLRQLGLNNKETSASLEKLSSGFRVNRAADDAAGLAISEKMRGQMRGLAMAETNADNGISLIQTAEGGLNETHAILQRMRELSVQSANGTYQDEDRAQIAKEFVALKQEINRIASSTHYNGIKLLDGTLGGEEATIQNTNDMLGMSGMTDIIINFVNHPDEADLANSVASIIIRDDLSVAIQINDRTFYAHRFNDGKPVAGVGKPVIEDNKVGGLGFGEGGTITFNGAVPTKAGVISGIKLNAAAQASFTIGDTFSEARVSAKDQKLVFQIGANGHADQRVGLYVENMGCGNLGSNNPADIDAYCPDGKLDSITVDTQDAANTAIKIIDAATNQVSGTRAQLGALQNRLEHTLNNLGVTKENLTAAESSIRDVDMAREMMLFQKNNILVQASQAMLAQSQQLPQGVLQLLR